MDSPPYAPPPQRPPMPDSGKKVARAGSLGVAALFLLGKVKWAFAALKVLKFGSLLSMLVSVGVYTMMFGFPYAAGFVGLIFVHEMGHALALRRLGIPAGAPVFIPFVGAVIAMKGRPRDAWVEAVVGIGGPALGTVGAAVVLGAALATNSALLYALASVGFLINLFNMLPISPLDGGRIVGAISRWLWLVGFAVGVPLFFYTHSPILMLILLLGALNLWTKWKQPVSGYYRIPAERRVAMGAAYFLLMILMVLGMAVADVALAELAPAQQAGLWAAAGLHALGGILDGGGARGSV